MKVIDGDKIEIRMFIDDDGEKYMNQKDTINFIKRLGNGAGIDRIKNVLFNLADILVNPSDTEDLE